MKKNTTKKILNYSAMSAAILGAADVTGQIVYTDVDPDEVIELGGSFNVDLNGDGIGDFNPQVFDAAGGAGAVIFPTSSGSNANQGSNGNGFVGVTAGAYEYPSNLSAGALINEDANFITDARGDLNFYSCSFTNSQFCDGTVDGFLGVSFELDGNTHYGWIRVDVGASGTPITVKDFAFNATPDTAIAAGEQNTAGVEDQAFEGFTHFVDGNNNLNLSARTAIESVTLHNVLGQQVISQKLSNTDETVQLSSLKSGVYVATVVLEGRARSFKIAVR